jgi:glycosyltransferase involved in cell wall biosynthesis
MNHKKICIVSAQYLPHTGGVENYVANLSAELCRRGHEVTILTSCDGKTVERESAGGVEIIRLPSHQFMDGRFPFLRHGKALRQFTKEFSRRSFDLMLVNVRFYPLSLYALRLARKMGVRALLLDHGSSHVTTGGKLTTKIGEWYEHIITWLEKRQCREFACVSKAGTEWVKHFGIDTDTVLPNAVSVERFERMKADSKRDFRAEYGIPENAKVISFVGRVTVEKGIRELVDAFEKINREDVWLLAAGEGYLKEELEARKIPNLRFVGRIPLEEVVSLLMQSDIFCLPSVSEGFPTSVLEASMCHAYVITTYCGDAKEIVRSPEHGIILPDNNTEGVYRSLMQVLDADEHRAHAVELCYNVVVENYTWEKTADKLLAIMEGDTV